MPNKVYDNFYLSTLVEDQYNSRLDLQQFCTVDNTLTGTVGMLKKVRVYKATDGTQKLKMGEGNTKDIDASFSEREYRIELAQNRFHYWDEEQMTDPTCVDTGMNHAAVDMYNTTNKDIFTEFQKATLSVDVEKVDFDAFVDAVALLGLENLEGVQIFSFVSPKDMAKIRKNLGESLKYVESFARSGYVGTVAGVNLYTKKDAVPGEIIIGTKEAVTMFIKKGVETEQERDANKRGNSIYTRKYYVAALTDETKVIKIVDTTAGPAPMDKSIAAIPSPGDDLLGMTVYDLISPDISIAADGNVTGTIKHVEGFKEFSSVKAEQSGNYFPVYIPEIKDGVVKAQKNGSGSEVTLDPDGLLIFRVTAKTDTLKVTLDGKELTTFKFNDADLVGLE